MKMHGDYNDIDPGENSTGISFPLVSSIVLKKIIRTYVEKSFNVLKLFVGVGRVDDGECTEDPRYAEQDQHCTGATQTSPVAAKAVVIVYDNKLFIIGIK